MAMQLSPVQMDFAGQIINGSFAMPLSGISINAVGAVNPIGDFAMPLQGVSMAITGETVPFGAQVIHVEPEKRGIRVNRDDTVTPILLTEVTQL
jgi:hypothetical protein